jgi:hypothetical protein
LADQGWCRFHTGDVAGARADAKAAAALIDPSMYVEDLAVACGRLAQVFAALDDVAGAQYHGQLARDHWARQHAMQQSVIETLNHALERPAP